MPTFRRRSVVLTAITLVIAALGGADAAGTRNAVHRRIEAVMAQDERPYFLARFCLAGRRVVTFETGRSLLWDPDTGRAVGTLAGPPRWLYDAEHSGSDILGLNASGGVSVWNANTGLESRRFPSPTGAAHRTDLKTAALGWGRRAWLLRNDGRLFVRSLGVRSAWRLFEEGVSRIAVSQEFPYLALVWGDRDRSRVAAYDVRSSRKLWDAFPTELGSADWSRERGELITHESRGSRFEFVWRGTRSPEPIRTRAVMHEEYERIPRRFIEDRCRLFDGYMGWYLVRPGREDTPIARSESSGAELFDLDLSRDGKYALVSDVLAMPGELIDLKQGGRRRRFTDLARRVVHTSVSGSTLLMGYNRAPAPDRREHDMAGPDPFRLFNVGSGHPIPLPEELRTRWVLGAGVAGNGRYLVAERSMEVGTLFVWDLENARGTNVFAPRTPVGNTSNLDMGPEDWWRDVVPIGERQAAVMEYGRFPGSVVLILDLASATVSRRIRCDSTDELVGADGAGRLWVQTNELNQTSGAGEGRWVTAFDRETGAIVVRVRIEPEEASVGLNPIVEFIPDPYSGRLYFTSVGGEFGELDPATFRRTVWSRGLGFHPKLNLDSTGEWLAVSGRENELWNIRTGVRRGRWKGLGNLLPLADGTLGVSAQFDRATWWKLNPGGAVRLGEYRERFGEEGKAGSWFAFTPDGGYVSPDPGIPRELRVRGSGGRYETPKAHQVRRLSRLPKKWFEP